MADFESDIEEDLLNELVNNFGDRNLGDEINAALNEKPKYEMIDASLIRGERDEDDDSSEQEDNEDDGMRPVDGDQSPDHLGDQPIDIAATTKRDQIQIREMLSARDSRMPDIPTIFEIGGLMISRACTLVANSPAQVPFDTFDPAKIARRELIAGKSLRAVLRGDTRWKWSDFTCFPRGFLNEDESADSLHEMR